MIKLYGIEIHDELFELAWNDPFIQVKKDSIFLKKADATDILNYQDWLENGLFDFIIIRHPEITFNTDVFIKIFSLCVNLLANTGYLMVTTHFENEKEMLKLLLKLYKFNVFVEKENKNSPTIEKEGETSYIDRFLLISTK